MVSRTKYHITLLDLLQKGYLKVNNEIFHDWIQGQHKNEKITAKILENGDIQLNENKMKFKSLTSAACYYTNSPRNGWKWWYYRSEGKHRYSLHELRKKYMETEG